MLDTATGTLTLATAVACGLMAGVFFAFSSFVMRALARLPAPRGVAAMQSINVAVINPLFLGVLFGTGALCVALVLLAFAGGGPMPASAYVIAGGLLYVGGTVLVTMVGNVPLNNALAAVDPESDAGAALWAQYLVRWSAWNHIRTVTGIAATAAFILALG